MASLGVAGLLSACGPSTPSDTDGDTDPSGSTGPSSATTPQPTTVSPSTTLPPDETTASTIDPPGDTTDGTTSTEEGTTEQPPACETDCPDQPLDVLFVVDNSFGMGVPQRRLAAAVEGLMTQLEALQAASGTTLDLHLMVTTSDFGNPLCTPFEPAGYDPARGAPISTACTNRLQDFTDLTGTVTFTEACTDVCPAGVAPTDPFVRVAGADSNVPGGEVVAALQCLLPQGMVGCGYEAPLENMLQAINQDAAWNQGPTPFLRNDADLAIVLLTDESDCSVQDYTVMEDPAYQNVNPNTGAPSPSSALCWNAGVTCDGPDGMGVYSNCAPVVDGPLQNVSRYTSYLQDYLVDTQGKEVMMLALVGVPQVVDHAVDPPYEPTAGGIDDLVIRDWIGFPYPVGDLIPDEVAMGVTAADKTFQLGIGPGCTSSDMDGNFTQAQPPLRIQAVCEALDAQGSPHCCIESICGDYDGAMTCLRGMIEAAL